MSTIATFVCMTCGLTIKARELIDGTLVPTELPPTDEVKAMECASCAASEPGR